MTAAPPKVSKARDPFGYRLRNVYDAVQLISPDRVFGPKDVENSLEKLGNLMDDPFSVQELVLWLNALCSVPYQALVIVNTPTLNRNTAVYSDWQYKRV